MEQKTETVGKLDRYCVVCGKQYNSQFESCCTPSSLVAVKEEGFFKKRIKYFSLDGKPLDENHLSRMREVEKEAKRFADESEEREKRKYLEEMIEKYTKALKFLDELPGTGISALP